MKIEVNIEKKYFFGIIGVLIILVALGFAAANWDTTKTLWHDAKDVKVNLNGVDYDLNQTVNEKVCLSDGTNCKNTANTAISPKNGSINFLAYEDGIDNIYIQGDRLWIVNLGYQKPTNIKVNGISWNPTWFGTISGFGTTSSVFLLDNGFPSSDFSASFRKINGRVYAGLTQSPNSSSGYLAIVNLNDEASGSADWYQFEINWTLTS